MLSVVRSPFSQSMLKNGVDGVELVRELKLGRPRYAVKQIQTIEDVKDLLDIEASLSVDILSGLVKISGSASVFKEEISKSTEIMFVLDYKSEISFQSLPSEAISLEYMTHPENLNHAQYLIVGKLCWRSIKYSVSLVSSKLM